MGGGYASFFSLIKAIGLLLFVVGSASCENLICPFNYFFHTGDGYFDTGNAIYIQPDLPASELPYGRICPGFPTGRWSDGFLDVDIGGAAMGFPNIAPYLAGISPSDTAVNFAVAGSTILDRYFFTSRKVRIPPYATPLRTQMGWLLDYLKTVCSPPTGCAHILADSMFLFGDIEANDVAMPITQGKSIDEARTYVPFVNDAQIDAARMVIKMGATRVILMGNVPIGCYPYILTELGTRHAVDYDELGCLRSVNELIQYKNADLESRVTELAGEYPDLIILYADFYGTFLTVLKETMKGPNKDKALKACCGTGGKYHFNRDKFCGRFGVPVCRDPGNYVHWDGMHLTQATHNRLMTILKKGIAPTFNCTVPPPPEDICPTKSKTCASSNFI